MLRSYIGWDKEHAPYQMYDFNAQGDLVGYPPDPNYAAFTEAADQKALLGNLPLHQSHAVAGWSHPVVHRSYDLLKAILKEEFINRTCNKKTKVGLVYGYDNLTPAYGTRYGPFPVAEESWRIHMAELCEEMGIIGIDLATHLPKRIFTDKILWEHDAHLTATGNYLTAAALAEEIARLPAFKKLIEERSHSPASTTADLDKQRRRAWSLYSLFTIAGH